MNKVLEDSLIESLIRLDNSDYTRPDVWKESRLKQILKIIKKYKNYTRKIQSLGNIGLIMRELTIIPDKIDRKLITIVLCPCGREIHLDTPVKGIKSSAHINRKTIDLKFV